MSYRVRIIGEHPHKGESGTVHGSPVNGMIKVQLDHCPHGVEECYADASEVRPLPRAEDPEAT